MRLTPIIYNQIRTPFIRGWQFEFVSIFNVGKSTALNWLVNHLDSMIKTPGLDRYRKDMNGEGPLPTSRKNGAENRQGITENF